MYEWGSVWEMWENHNEKLKSDIVSRHFGMQIASRPWDLILKKKKEYKKHSGNIHTQNSYSFKGNLCVSAPNRVIAGN